MYTFDTVSLLRKWTHNIISSVILSDTFDETEAHDMRLVKRREIEKKKKQKKALKKSQVLGRKRTNAR